ncbi:uncharacterized protein LOC128238636 isoform X2 [Mya arenaria]|uniref:uncharacterized protein LOC128238636 isoform X1 n=1 Tax=Mya arenaria TaxID=6604 RepID=UPI0022DF9F9B|nr:uncharacterized protein LOC128238636 isoform X1 [Mya arenaria]XP_052810714.1 uncharacterized protein LOC128238636 isoform X2 [Mya arenaria]
MASKPIQTSAKISSFIEFLTLFTSEKLNDLMSDGLTTGLNTLYFKYEEVKENILKMAGCVKTESKLQLKQFLFQAFPFFQRLVVEEIGKNIIDSVLVAKTIFLSYVGCLNFLIKTASHMQGLFGLNTTESFVTKEIDYITLPYTAVPRNDIDTIFQIDVGSTAFDTIPQSLIANHSSIESSNDQLRYSKWSNSTSTVFSIDKSNVIVHFQASENDIEHDAINSVNTNDADNEIRFKCIVQGITDRIQELVRSFTGVSFTYDEIRDALMEANRSNGHVVRSGNSYSSDSVYRVRVTRLRMRVVITVEMFGRALRYCEGYDYVLTHTNIFPHNIRMFLHLPVLRGCSVHLIDCKEGRNF